MYLKAPSSSKAFSPPDSFGIYLNSKNVFSSWLLKEEETKLLENEIIEALASLESPYDGKPVFAHIFKREEIFPGPYARFAPHIMLVPREEYWVDHEFGSDIIEKKSHVNHHLIGLFGILGEGVRCGEYLGTISIYDVTPTVLHYFNVPIDFRMDGKPLKEAFEYGSFFVRRPIRKANYHGRWIAIKRLRRMYSK